MDGAKGVLPPVQAACRPHSRGSSCRSTFLRSTLQKLNADSTRRGHPIESNAVEPLNTKIGHTFWPDLDRTQHDPWQHDRCYVTDRCYLKGILTEDLERYRSSLIADMHSQLVAVQTAVQETDVGGLSQRFLDEVNMVRKREEDTSQECDRLRAHLEELLRLNAQLRQHELLTQMDAVRKHTQVLDEDCGAIQKYNQQIGESAQTMLTCMGQISEFMKPLQDTKALVEKIGNQVRTDIVDDIQKLVLGERPGIIDDIRKLVVGELQPLKDNMQDFRDRLKRVEGSQLEAQQEGKEHHLTSHGHMIGLLEQVRGMHEQASAHRQSLSESLESTKHMAKDMSHRPDTSNTERVLSSISEQTSMLSENSGKMCVAMAELHKHVENIPNVVSTMVEKIDTADEAEVRRLKVEAANAKRQLEKAERDLADGSPASTLIKLLNIEDRGNVAINFRTGEVDVKRDIPFDPKNQQEEPLGEFKDEQVALEIIRDIFEIWDLFKVNLAIEGHTKGGENDFWQALANNRAQLIVDTLHGMGVDKKKMTSKGLPGELGLNKVGVVVQLDIFPKR